MFPPKGSLLVTGLALGLLLTFAAERFAVIGEQIPRRKEPLRTDLYGDPLPDGAIARLGTKRFLSLGPMWSMALSPDGKVLATGGEDGAVRTWDAATGKALVVLQGHRDDVQGLAFSPDGKTLASAGNDGLLRLWEANSGKPIWTCKVDKCLFFAVAFTPDGKSLATAGSDGQVRTWATATGKPLLACEGNDDSVFRVTYSPEGKTLATGSKNGVVALWEAGAGKEIRAWQAHLGCVASVEFAPDGKTLVTNGGDHRIGIWEVLTGKEVRNWGLGDDSSHEVACSPDGRMLASAGWHGEGVRLWDPATGKEIRLCEPAPRGGRLCRVLFSPDGKTLFAGGVAGQVRRWDVSTGALLQTTHGHEEPVAALAFSPDGSLVVSSGSDLTVRLWEAASGRQFLCRKFESESRWAIDISAVVFTHDGKALAYACTNGEVTWVEVATGKVKVVSRPSSPDAAPSYSPLSFSPDGQTLAAGRDGSVRLYDDDPKRLNRVLPGERGEEVRALAYSPDGRILATASAGKNGFPIRLWDVATSKPILELGNGESNVHTLAFSPDGNSLASGDEDGRIVVWDTARGQKTLTILGGGGQVAWSRDGRMIATVDGNGVLRLWETASGLPILSHKLPEISERFRITFSPDIRFLATLSHENSILIWDLLGLVRASRQPGTGLARSLEALGQDLESLDAGRAYEAAAILVRNPEQAVALAREKLQLRPPPSSALLKRLLAELNDEDFATRERAEAELAKLGRLVEPALRASLEAGPSLDKRRRLEKLLENLQSYKEPPERWREVRALLILEYLGTPESVRHLKKLAAGYPDARLTREAKESLERMARRTDATP